MRNQSLVARTSGFPCLTSHQGGPPKTRSVSGNTVGLCAVAWPLGFNSLNRWRNLDTPWLRSSFLPGRSTGEARRFYYSFSAKREGFFIPLSLLQSMRCVLSPYDRFTTLLAKAETSWNEFLGNIKRSESRVDPRKDSQLLPAQNTIRKVAGWQNCDGVTSNHEERQKMWYL